VLGLMTTVVDVHAPHSSLCKSLREISTKLKNPFTCWPTANMHRNTFDECARSFMKVGADG
jgi:hypothetical protein